jgi:hypothetical protein
MTDRDPKDDDRDDDLDDEEEEESPPPPKAKPKASASSAPKGKAASSAKGSAPKASLVPMSTAIVIGIAALAVGGAAGWFGQIQKTKAAIQAESKAAPAGSGVPSGPCGAWQSQICKSVGDQSASCQQAKGAIELLSGSTCEAALATVPATLAKVKAARAPCDKLVGKLCADLPPGSKTCDMVKERTPSFPRERCDQMLQSYDKVIAELKQMDQQPGGMQMGQPHMQAPGGMPPGAMPGAMPHVTMPPGTTQP